MIIIFILHIKNINVNADVPNANFPSERTGAS